MLSNYFRENNILKDVVSYKLDVGGFYIRISNLRCELKILSVNILCTFN